MPTATFLVSWVCLHPQAIIITTRPTTPASTEYTHSMASQEAWGPIPSSQDQSLNTSPQAWWPCAWRPKTQGACYPGQHDCAAAALAMTSLSQQTLSMPAHSGMWLRNTFFNARCTTLSFFCRLPDGFSVRMCVMCPDSLFWSVFAWKQLICLCTFVETLWATMGFAHELPSNSFNQNCKNGY